MKPSFRKTAGRILSVLLAAQLVVVNALPVSAGLFSAPKLPSTSSMFSDMEQRYHIDQESIQSQVENLNVGDNKKISPEVSLFFSPSDPKVGEKITAKAFPVYFSNDAKNLYYTWYLKHKGCDINKNPNEATIALCERDKKFGITIEDWKVEAMLLLAQNGFDKADANYSTTEDDQDGYKARYGGDNKTSAPDHCYINDTTNGKNYELLAEDAEETTYDCPAGTEPICLEGEVVIDPAEVDPNAPSPAFGFTNTDVCHVAGTPVCSDDGTVSCGTGAPRCVANPGTTTSCGTELTACNGTGSVDTSCKHLFADAPNAVSGDGVFNVDEEEFWGTNPNDSSTADNGNKDEANVVGLGQTSFTWNYAGGDEVGLAVEGNATTNTKYADSSYMIMWAFSKKDCPISLASSTGTLTKRIKNYDVVIPTAKMDLNKCIERNLIDPTKGGQATNLEVDLTTSPDSPLNDESVDEAGDVIAAQVTVSNASHAVSEMLFEWEVEISKNSQFTNPVKITKDLQDMGLLGNAKGIALDTLRLRLNIPNKADKPLGGAPLGDYLTGETGYLRFVVKVSESFASGAIRKGNSNVIVKFTSTGDKIIAYKVKTVPAGDQMRVALDAPGGIICNGDPNNPSNDKDKLDRVSCRVIKNEIIGLWIDPEGLKNFNWTINGKSLLCTKKAVSSDCENDESGATRLGEQNHVNFFPVSGDVGDSYTVTVTANEIKTDKLITLTRSFHVVKPLLSIASLDQTAAWPKLLGAYKDITGADAAACPNGSCPEYSESVFQALSGDSLSFKGVFMPNFLAGRSVRQWTVDGVDIAESGNVVGGAIAFAALKEAPNVYNISLQASVVQPQEIRQALHDIWGISPLDSPEIRFSTTGQVELSVLGLAQEKGAKKYLAAISSYVPASVIFLFRIALSIFLLIFAANMLYALLPEQAVFSKEFFRRK